MNASRPARPASGRTETARGLMADFGERTGLTSTGAPERYLWTDAFAVCNLLALGQTELARRLADQVHNVLGRHRADDPRDGWLSGLDEAAGDEHPTIGGLRIGKKLPERRPNEPVDERLEWERDGQYFHYLTRWMHALNRLARATGEGRYNVWARELAQTAHRAFTYFDPVDRGGRRMYWKMSVDLSRPLVSAMGQHDPLDGYVTCLELDASAVALGVADSGPSLVAAAGDFRAMVPAWLMTADPLGIGGLLIDAWRLGGLGAEDGTGVTDDGLRDRLVDAAAEGLAVFEQVGELALPASQRLAFRELGLAIGLHAAERMAEARLRPFFGLREEIESYWLEPDNRGAATWLEHRNINNVMLATSLVPSGYLG